MKNTTLCYIYKDKKCLSMHRSKKKNDPNKGKWVGIGGKFEETESPVDCLLREVKEETGLLLTKFEYRGIVTFVSDKWETEQMHLFTASDFLGDVVSDCAEGDLQWVDAQQMHTLPMWEGDSVFLSLLQTQTEFFSLKLCYRGECLTNAVLNGIPMKKGE